MSTAAVSEITAFSAVSGGEITNDGGSAITAKGVVFGSEPGVTLDNGTVIENGENADTYSSSISDLLWTSKYYVRSYATNSTGTGYGDELIGWW